MAGTTVVCACHWLNWIKPPHTTPHRCTPAIMQTIAKTLPGDLGTVRHGQIAERPVMKYRVKLTACEQFRSYLSSCFISATSLHRVDS